MECPILPVEGVSGVIYEGNMVRLVQQALTARGFYTGAVDGRYGPETAAALRAFQDSRPLDTFEERLLRLVNVRLASCATYRALGIPCDSVYPVLGVTGNDWLVGAIVLAVQMGQLDLGCGVRLPGLPKLPSREMITEFLTRTWPYWVAGGVGAAGFLILLRAGKR